MLTRGVARIPPKLHYALALVSSGDAIWPSSKCKASRGDAPKLLTPVIVHKRVAGARESPSGTREVGGQNWVLSRSAEASRAAQASRPGSAARSDATVHHHDSAEAPGWKKNEQTKKKPTNPKEVSTLALKTQLTLSLNGQGER